MAVLSFRRRPRKSSNPRRAWMHEFQFLPLIEKEVAFKKSWHNKGKRRMVHLARITTMISLPNLDDCGLNDREPSKKSCENPTSEVEISGQRKMKITFQRKVVVKINIQDQVMLQKESINNNVSSSEQQQQLPLRFKNYIKGLGATGKPVLVIQKELFSTDLNPGHQRFSILVKKVINHGFLTGEERSRFNRENKQEAIDAILIEPSLVQSRITFKKWYMNKSEVYVLMGGWNKVVKRNELWTTRAAMVIQEGLAIVFCSGSNPMKLLCLAYCCLICKLDSSIFM